MPALIFSPRQPHYLLVTGDQTHKSGDIFEGPKSLLLNEDIAEAPKVAEVVETTSGTTSIAKVGSQAAPPQNSPQSPDRAERDPAQKTRSEDK